MQVTFAYQTRTDVVTNMNTSALDFATNTRRRPVSFQGIVKEPVLMRQMMIALHEVIIGDYRWQGRGWLLDPVITVHPDELFFEAFSNDGSTYVRLSADNEAFDVEYEPTYGTTNIDFTFALRDALSSMRSARKTHFTIGAGGFAVETQTALGSRARYESKVDLPDDWVKGFLQVQSALTMRPFTFDVAPVDLLTVIHFLQDNRARKPPNALRYEFAPGEPIRAVLEPWNSEFTFEGTAYEGYKRTIRTWGRQRLELLLNVLPYADRVTIGVLGRGLPHFYTCHCGGYKFTLVLSGWVRSDWASSSALDLLAPQTEVDGETIATVYNALVQHLKLSRGEVESYTLLDSPQVEASLFRLCREGRAIYDPVTRRYRSRELFAEPLNAETILALDPRIEAARKLAADGAAVVHSVAPSEVRKNEVKILATVTTDGRAHDVLVAVDHDSRVRFAQCECEFFREHIMNRGPCEHILAARFAAENQLTNIEKLSIMG